MTPPVDRREFLKDMAAGVVGAQLAGPTSRANELPLVAALPAGVTRTWIGPAFWANRLQDWRLSNGRIECLAGDKSFEIRTVAILTRELMRGASPAHLSVRCGVLEDAGGGGFCGFLIGAGAGDVDYRAAALVQRSSGTGGGILCTYGSDGACRFREHTDEQHPLAFAELPPDPDVDRGLSPDPKVDRVFKPGQAEAVTLRLDITPQPDGTFVLQLRATDDKGRAVAERTRRSVRDVQITGGIALVSSPSSGVSGTRYWFNDLRSGGAKIATREERAFGPVLGTLHTLNERVLKLSAQLAPVGDGEPQEARFDYRIPQGQWQAGPTARLERGWSVLFRLETWDGSRDWEYRVVYPAADPDAVPFSGMIRREPSGRPLTIGLMSCTIAAARPFDNVAPAAPELPQAEVLGRYTEKNIFFPHRTLAANLARHKPDLLVFCGDQFYEGNPTRRDNDPAPLLDYLYKWMLWIWSFRDLTRDTPAIVIVDDHDVYQGNLWGNGGRVAPNGEQNRGGYRCAADWVNTVQRTQCRHDPDPFDPTPVEQDIGVYYGAFRYGGVSFAVLEDRKFKTAPLQGEDLDVHEAVLLGDRQEAFLEAWARMHAGDPKVCVTQTLFACLQTSPGGRPLLDFDANGYPKPGRDRAVALLRAARALVLAGDQHLASVVRHGLDSFTDGVLQFAGPAGGTSWQRWFEPAAPLPNARGPHTGDFVDGFGNKVRVLAIANPRISFREYRQHRKGRQQGLGDRRLKSEGYGIVRVDRAKREFVLECWPWNVDPTASSGRQFPGWPIRISFDEVT